MGVCPSSGPESSLSEPAGRRMLPGATASRCRCLLSVLRLQDCSSAPALTHTHSCWRTHTQHICSNIHACLKPTHACYILHIHTHWHTHTDTHPPSNTHTHTNLLKHISISLLTDICSNIHEHLLPHTCLLRHISLLGHTPRNQHCWFPSVQHTHKEKWGRYKQAQNDCAHRIHPEMISIYSGSYCIKHIYELQLKAPL